MDRVEKHSELLQSYLQAFVEVAQEEETSLYTQLIVDESNASYLVLTYGWTAERFVHFVVFHFAIKADGKIWLYQNRTNKVVLEELSEIGVAEEDIVLALVQPYYSELALAA